METNVFEDLDSAIERSGGRELWAVQAPFAPARDFDVRLLSRVANWRESDAACDSLNAFERESGSLVTVRSASGVGVRLGEDALARAEQRLASLDLPGRARRARGRAVVYFWGANTTKALHVGHLRDVAIGNALSATLAASGMEVERRSLIADCGRGMGEAIAGVVRSGRANSRADELPQKSDQFVGECYSRYVQAQPAAVRDPIESSDSVHREAIMHDDSADAILDRLTRGDSATRDLWLRTREWVMAGQHQTLDRLSVPFDDVVFESEFLGEMARLSELGLAARLLSVREDGVVVYLTGHEELAEMPLERADGLPTQHLRALAYWASAPDLDGSLSIQVCGSEWVAHVACRRQLIDELAKIAPAVDRRHPTRTVFHGMVAERGQRVASSQGALLIDDVLEWIEAEIASGRSSTVTAHQTGTAEAAGAQAVERIAARVALGYFLLQPLGKAVEIELPAFFRAGSSLGWDLTRARAHPWAARSGGDAADDGDYRFTIFRAELLERLVQTATETLDVVPLARHASHFAQWFVERERTQRVWRAAQRVLDDAERTLGLIPTAGR